MRRLLLVASLLALTACGGGSSDSSSPSQPDPINTINQPPTVSIEGELAFTAESRFTLKTTLTDKENDTLQVSWSSNYQGVEFLNTTTNATEVKLPNVSETTTITLTVTVTDSANNKVSKSYTITVSPKPDTNVALFDLKPEYRVKTNEDIQIPVNFESPYLISSVDWEFEGFTPRGLETNSEFSDKTGKSILNFQAPNVSQTTSFDLTLTLTTSNAIYHAKTKLVVTVDDLPAFTVSFSSPLQLVEGQEGELKTDVVRSEDITFFEWNWMPKPEPEIIRVNSSSLKFKSPEVDKDTVFDVALTLTGASGRQVKATTQVTVKDASTTDPVVLTGNRYYVTTGHLLIIDVSGIDLDNVVSFKWNADSVDANTLKSTKARLEVTIPKFSEKGKALNFNYEAEFKSGQKQTGTLSVVYLTSEQVNKALELTASEPMNIFPKEQASHVFTLKDQYNLIDTIEIISNHSENVFSTLQAKHAVEFDYVTVTALIDNPKIASDVPLTAILKSGTVETRKVLNAKLHVFKLAAYPGLEEMYYRGSSFYLIGLALKDDKAQPFSGMWTSTNDEYSMVNASASVAKADPLSSYPILPKFGLYVKDASNRGVLESLNISIKQKQSVQTDQFTCSWGSDQLICRDNQFNQYKTQQTYAVVRQVVAKHNYACVVGNDDRAECVGSHNTMNDGIASLQNVAKLNPVDDSTVCAQHINTSWSCVGENADRYQSIIDNGQTVFGIEGFGDKTCYVENGYLKCCTKGQTPYFSTRPEYVKSFDIDEAKNKLCYKTMDAIIEQCHPF